MHGHTPILQMRIDGIRPQIVFVDDFKNPCAADWHNPGEGMAPDHAKVQIDQKDRIESLDLRFLKGLTVAATSMTEQRARALLAACKRAGASIVVASHVIQINPHRFQTGWTEMHTNG